MSTDVTDLTPAILASLRQELNRRIDETHTRIAHLEKRLDGIDVRLDGIDARLHGIDLRLDALGHAVQASEDRIMGQLGTISVAVLKLYDLVVPGHAPPSA